MTKRPIRRRPRKGWRIIDRLDLEHTFHPDATCDRCGRLLRFAVILRHPRWYRTLTAGRTCATRLTSKETE